MDIVDRNFYHSFPRVLPGQTPEHVTRVGLEILKSIKQVGLILAPETVAWKQPLIDGNDRAIFIRQRRICFTELSRGELREHGKRFGPFSLELRLDVLRRLGAFPVVYVPQRVGEDRSYSSVGETVVVEIADIKHTLSQLNDLLQLTDPGTLLALAGPGATHVADDCVVNLQNKDPSSNIVASYPIALKDIKSLLSYIGYRNAPFDLMIGVLSFVQSLFYPTDDMRHDRLLDYYRQREWRLVSGLTVGGSPQSRPLTNSEKELLMDIDARFWSKELSDDDSSFRRVDDAQVIDKLDGSHISEAISAVLVPPDAYEEARLLFGDKVLVVE